ncbi:pyruvate, water dikinase [Anaerolineales bacterium]|nr:pyruvate, water dikinase [Anaerolineales bacterium]
MPFIKKITELDQTDLPIAGGKGANLGALLQAGLPVPGGFVVTIAGYRAFVAANNLDVELHRILESIQMDDPASLESGSEQIRACFRSGQIPSALADEIRRAYLTLHNQPQAVAVRSSATAEDLPDLSFAGQQDTYLNILGEEALLEAVIRCWASLWTARAIGYRARNAICHDDIALAVVVQQMVQSEASGVLFTANPLTGKRSETVIEATFGLGEALVSGQVEPDHYMVEPARGLILSKTLGAKALAIQGQQEGGTISVERDEAQRQALPDEQILALTRLGQQAAAHFGTPQDIEWAWADGRMYVVQSRPITSLYPLPENVAGEPLEVMLSFGVWQGMLDPYTPLSQDMFGILISGMGELFGQNIKVREQRVFLSAGERLFVNLTGLLQNPLGRNILNVFISAIDPVSGVILSEIIKDLHLPAEGNLSLGDRLRLARGVAPVIGNVLFNLLWPARGRARLEANVESVLAGVQAHCSAAQSLSTVIATIEAMPGLPLRMLPYLVGGIAAGQAPFQILLRQAATIPGGPELVMELTRGLPHNVTTQMDLVLWQTAQSIRADINSATHFSTMDTETLIAEYRQGQLPTAAQTAIQRFLVVYGMRGIGEIDLGRPRWREDPTNLFQVLKSYLQIDPQASPEAVFQRGVEKAKQAQEQLVEAFKQSPGGKAKARLEKIMWTRIRELGGLRETPKFFVIRLFGHFRTALLSAGQKLVEAGTLAEAEDVFFLHLWELKTLGNGGVSDWKALVTERRATYARELRRRRIPRLILSDGTAFYDAPTLSTENNPNILSGNPVSAGVIEGTVRVVLDPHGVQLVPGEILVCPATDPAWTPLFLSASGLVMEVGGMMTHGSVVAREYGIPAVVGVQNATGRLKDRQKVRVDGSSGKIAILQA